MDMNAYPGEGEDHSDRPDEFGDTGNTFTGDTGYDAVVDNGGGDVDIDDDFPPVVAYVDRWGDNATGAELAERLPYFTETTLVPVGSLALRDEVDGVPYEELPYTTSAELTEIAAAKQAAMTAKQEQGGENPKLAKPTSVEGMIGQTTGPFLEIGGPSTIAGGKTSIDFDATGKPLIVSNVYPQEVDNIFWRSPIHGDANSNVRPGLSYRLMGEGPMQDPKSWRTVRRIPDAKIDGENLPEGEGYLGAIYARAIHPLVESPIIATEAPRALEPGGILVLDNVKDGAVEAVRASPYLDLLKVRTSGLHPAMRHTSITARRNDTPYVPPIKQPDADNQQSQGQ